MIHNFSNNILIKKKVYFNDKIMLRMECLVSI